MRSHPLRNVLSVVVTEHDPATGATTTQAWRIDLRAAPRETAGLLRRCVLLAVPIIAATAQDLPGLADRATAALDADLDGYPTASGHAGRSSEITNPTYDTAVARLDDDRAERIRIVQHNLDATILAATALRGAVERLARA